MTCWCGEGPHSSDKHKRKGEPPCEGSRLARNEYAKWYYHNVTKGRVLIPEYDEL